MKWYRLALLTLLCLTIRPRTHKPIHRKMILILLRKHLPIRILSRRVLGIPGRKLILGLTFGTLYNIHHLPNSPILHILILLLPHQLLDHVLVDILAAAALVRA